MSGLMPLSVPQYRSPSFSQEGYAAFEAGKLVKGWFGDTARAPGGVAYSIAAGYGEALQNCDQGQNQYCLQEMRLQSCQGSQIDSWSLDMVGPMFSRYFNEPDPAFIARNMVMVGRPRTTINSIQKFVQAFLNSTSIIQFGQNLAFSQAGAGGYSVSGGYSTVAPIPAQGPTIPNPVQVFVWDNMTEPGLVKLYADEGFVITPGQFVIQFGVITLSLKQQLAYSLAGAGGYSSGWGGFSNVNEDATLPPISTAAPDPRLGLLINWLAKAGGTVPLYLTGSI